MENKIPTTWKEILIVIWEQYVHVMCGKHSDWYSQGPFLSRV